jgi:VanZ family protein
MNSRQRVFAAGVSLLVYAAISLLSSIPARSLPSGIPGWIPHGGEYFLLAFFFIQAWARPRRTATLAAAFILLAGLGLLDEWHQLFVPGRVFSLLDWLYDMLGSAVGMAAFLLFAKTRIRNK